MRSKLVQSRLDKGFSQQDVATLLGVTRACYSNYEKGTRNPSIEKVVKLKNILGVSDDQIFLLDNATFC